MSLVYFSLFLFFTPACLRLLWIKNSHFFSIFKSTFFVFGVWSVWSLVLISFNANYDFLVYSIIPFLFFLIFFELKNVYLNKKNLVLSEKFFWFLLFLAVLTIFNLFTFKNFRDSTSYFNRVILVKNTNDYSFAGADYIFNSFLYVFSIFGTYNIQYFFSIFSVYFFGIILFFLFCDFQKNLFNKFSRIFYILTTFFIPFLVNESLVISVNWVIGTLLFFLFFNWFFYKLKNKKFEPYFLIISILVFNQFSETSIVVGLPLLLVFYVAIFLWQGIFLKDLILLPWFFLVAILYVVEPLFLTSNFVFEVDYFNKLFISSSLFFSFVFLFSLYKKNEKFFIFKNGLKNFQFTNFQLHKKNWSIIILNFLLIILIIIFTIFLYSYDWPPHINKADGSGSGSGKNDDFFLITFPIFSSSNSLFLKFTEIEVIVLILINFLLIKKDYKSFSFFCIAIFMGAIYSLANSFLNFLPGYAHQRYWSGLKNLTFYIFIFYSLYFFLNFLTKFYSVIFAIFPVLTVSQFLIFGVVFSTNVIQNNQMINKDNFKLAMKNNLENSDFVFSEIDSPFFKRLPPLNGHYLDDNSISRIETYFGKERTFQNHPENPTLQFLDFSDGKLNYNSYLFTYDWTIHNVLRGNFYNFLILKNKNSVLDLNLIEKHYKIIDKNEQISIWQKL